MSVLAWVKNVYLYILLVDNLDEGSCGVHKNTNSQACENNAKTRPGVGQF